MSVAEPIAGRVRALRKLVGEDLTEWLEAHPEELDADAWEAFTESYEPKGRSEK